MTNTITCEGAKAHAAQEMDKLFDRVPFAKEFHTGVVTDSDYYIRHLMETILRIRLNNEVDAYCLYKIGYKNNRLAQKLAQYLSEEINHENFFLNDLKTFNIDIKTLNDTKVFFSTEKLIGYLYYCINQEGPMVTMVWNWFVEWYSNNYNKIITSKAGKELGEKHIIGFDKHIEFDEDHDHVSLMFSTIEMAASDINDLHKIKVYLSNFIFLIGDYFQELYDSTIGIKSLQRNTVKYAV